MELPKMKKFNRVFFAIVLIVTSHSIGYSQDRQNLAEPSGLCVKKYDIIVDGFYGYPYLGGVFFKQILIDSLGIKTDKIHNLNHFGGKVEYLVWNKIGFGLEYTYGLLNINYLGKGGKYYKAGINKQRILLKFNFHFATSEKLDPYLTAGVGYANTRIFTNEPGIKDANITFVPVAVRVGIGMRYFFTDMVGINMEVGLGGPLMQAGLSFKF